MLVVQRKLGERLFIGEDIVVTVTLIDRGRVRLAIEGPRSIPVWREELAPAELVHRHLETLTRKGLR